MNSGRAAPKVRPTLTRKPGKRDMGLWEGVGAADSGSYENVSIFVGGVVGDLVGRGEYNIND